MEFPKEFTDRMRSLLGDESLAFFASMEEEPVRSFRINTLKCEERELVEALGKEQISFCSEGYIFDMEHIGAHPYHHACGIYVQEPAAMAVA